MYSIPQENPIQVIDAMMGSGKTTNIIDYMNAHNDKKFIYITPNLSECERILKACPKLNFKKPIPDKKHKTKLKNLEKLIEQEENIVSTHALLKNFTKDTLELLINRNYHLILDEAIEPCENYEMKKSDIKILFDSKFVGIAEDGITLEWLQDKPERGSKFYYEYRLIENGNLVTFDFNNSKSNKQVLIWELTPNLLNSFLSVTILTYQFEGSILKPYFDIKDIKYTIDTTTVTTDKKIGHLIEVCEDERMNEAGKHLQALGHTSLSKAKNKSVCEAIGKHAYNFVRNICKASSDKVMWSTFKDTKNSIKRKGFTRGFIPLNTKATNEFKDKTVLIYALNRFMDVPLKRYLENRGVEVNQDLWALNELLQWIFRSAIRDGKPIKIYIPSRRMRSLLLEWIKDH
jgi:hypothetical protein